MDDIIEILTSTATRLFDQQGGDAAARAARQGELPNGLWSAIAEAGLPLALLSEDQGGFGLPPGDALHLIRIGGRFGSPAPLGETMIANWLLATLGGTPGDRPASFAQAEMDVAQEGDGWRVKGEAYGVPWGRHAETIVLIGGGKVVALQAGETIISNGEAGNGLPRDDLSFDTLVPADCVWSCPDGFAETCQAAGAVIRALEMGGALRTILEITVQYAGERVQFGKPLAKQQAIQQQLAVLAGQVAAANAAIDLASQAWRQGPALAPVAAAKARASEAAGIAAAIAHQVLGAIGFTEEHRLHIFTKALWVWRDDYGSERVWQRRLGAEALAQGNDGFWPSVTALGLVGEVA